MTLGMSSNRVSRGGPRILIVRLSAVGDVLHGLPVLNALRDQLPQAFLAWVVEGRAGTLLERHPSLDELICVPRGWLKSPRQVLRLRRRMRQLAFDVSIDVQGLTKSALAGWLSGAPRRIGFGGVAGRELSPWLNTELVDTSARHVIERNLDLLLPLGISRPAVRFGLTERAIDGLRAKAMLVQAGLTPSFAVINPGAGWTSKLWPPQRFGEVARYLGREHGLPSLVVWAGPQEQRWACQIVANAGGHAQIAPATSLLELAALTRRARMFIASDTGPLHLAAAVGTPCVGLYGPMPASRNGPYGTQHIALQKATFEGTSRERRSASPELMEAIQVADVCEACATILRRGKQAAA